MQESWLGAGEQISSDAGQRMFRARYSCSSRRRLSVNPVTARAAPSTNLNEILSYIHTGWDSLTRSTSSCAAVSDTKLSAAPVVYLPADFQQPKELEQMQRDCKVRVAHLPQVIHQLGTTDRRVDSAPWLALSQEQVCRAGWTL